MSDDTQWCAICGAEATFTVSGVTYCPQHAPMDKPFTYRSDPDKLKMLEHIDTLTTAIEDVMALLNNFDYKFNETAARKILQAALDEVWEGGDEPKTTA